MENIVKCYKGALLLSIFLLVAHSQAETVIAVPDLSYKKEVKEFFYYEAANSKSSSASASSYEASGYDRSSRSSAMSVDARRQDSFAAGGGSMAANSSGSYRGSAASSAKNDIGYAAKGSSASSSSSQSSYVKTYGDKIKIQYTELQGMSGEVRADLINAGFRISQTRPNVAVVGQTDSFFDVVGRIKSGQFGNAQYVLYGVVAAMETRSNREKIDGTDSYMNKYDMNITVDYNLIDTKTLQARSSFTVMATGNDNRIDNGQSGPYTPSSAKIMASASKSLGDEVVIKLAEQGFIDRPENLKLPSSVPQPTYENKPGSLKVFN
jgi:hypothetical protein